MPMTDPASQPKKKSTGRRLAWAAAALVVILPLAVVGLFQLRHQMEMNEPYGEAATVIPHGADEPLTQAVNLDQMRGTTGPQRESEFGLAGKGTSSGEPTMRP